MIMIDDPTYRNNITSLIVSNSKSQSQCTHHTRGVAEAEAEGDCKEQRQRRTEREIAKKMKKLIVSFSICVLLMVVWRCFANIDTCMHSLTLYFSTTLQNLQPYAAVPYSSSCFGFKLSACACSIASFAR
jgi:hypothetical protein